MTKRQRSSVAMPRGCTISTEPLGFLWDTWGLDSKVSDQEVSQILHLFLNTREVRLDIPLQKDILGADLFGEGIAWAHH